MIIEKAEVDERYPNEKASQAQGVPVQPSPEREQPPPYVEGSRPPGTTGESSSSGRPGTSRVNSVFQPSTQQHVNFVSLYSKHNSITGSYIINAELPGSPLVHTDFFRKRQRRCMKANNITPNATFQTRHGQISLNLATAGGTNVANKTYVQVTSRHGRVNVNLFALQPNKHICLEVATRHAPIVLFIPPNFQGALHLQSRKGNVKFLPAFANQARVVNADDEGALVLFGQGEISLAEPTSDGLDYCSLVSRHGKLTIGISGVDQFDAATDTSLIKKLGTMFLGPDIMRTVDMLRDRGTLHQ